ncbi:MAG: choice-of-anchor B family protein [Myxococcales bacterium FL481]|nr:MAG: choice-of-anchor B family protein [Myxococcales bacterium FL481]
MVTDSRPMGVALAASLLVGAGCYAAASPDGSGVGNDAETDEDAEPSEDVSSSGTEPAEDTSDGETASSSADSDDDDDPSDADDDDDPSGDEDPGEEEGDDDDVPDSDDDDDVPEELCAGPNKPKPCVGGEVEGYDCGNVELLSITSTDELGGGRVSDMWGWLHRDRRFAVIVHTNGTAFVEVTDPCNPVMLGMLPQSSSANAIHHDPKVWDGWAFIVSEAQGHGMQVFDLRRLLDVASPQAFEADAHYDGFGSAHNIVIDEETGYGFAVGSGTCSGGLHMLDLHDPLSPTRVGCFSQAGYVHDAQCLIYRGPDTEHADKEICVTFNGGSGKMSVVDVTDKSSPRELSRTGYPKAAYCHQGWFTSDLRYMFVGDELDEGDLVDRTRTLIFDMSDLDEPVLIGEHFGATRATDHNQYVVGDRLYQANDGLGLQVFDTADVSGANLTEVAYLDTLPGKDEGFDGLWSVYPFWPESEVIGASDRNLGLVMVRIVPQVP